MSSESSGRESGLDNILQLPKGKYKFPRFLSLVNLVAALTEPSSALDYGVIRPVLLAIPSFTSPFEFFRCMIGRYYESNEVCTSTDQVKFKVLAVIHCWLEQPFAHSDLITASFEKHLKKFLKQVLRERNDFLTNICQSIRFLLRRLVAETAQLDLANQLYQLRSTPSLGREVRETVPLSSSSADDVRVLESPMSRFDEEGSRRGAAGRYYELFQDGASPASPDRSFSESYSCDDYTGDVLRSILAEEQDSKSESATGSGSYSTVRLSGSTSNRPAWVYDSNLPAPGGPEAGVVGAGGPSDGEGGAAAPPPCGSRTDSGPVGGTTLRGDHPSKASCLSARSTRMGGELVASPALTMMSTSVIQMYKYDKLAELLTVVESEIGWASLRHRELVNKLWMKEDLKTVHPDLGGASHLTKFIAATDRRMAWISSEIIYYGVFVGPISDALEYFIKVAYSAYLRNNFNSFFQIISALGLPCIKHLKAGWTNCSRSKINLYGEMVKFSCPQRNFAAYRKRFDATSDSPRIPCLQIFLKDISMLDSIHPSLNDDGLIDVYKILHMWKIITAAIPVKCVGTQHEGGLPIDQIPKAACYDVDITSDNSCEKPKESASGGMSKSYSYGSLVRTLTDRRKSSCSPIEECKSPAVTDITATASGGEGVGEIEPDASAPCLSNLNILGSRMTDMPLDYAGPSLYVQSSFEDACGACRESLFEPIRNSAHILASCQSSLNLNYRWDEQSRSIAVEGPTKNVEEDDSGKEKMSHISISAKSSEMLAAIFSPVLKAAEPTDTAVLKSGLQSKSTKLFKLASTDRELVELLWKIRSSTADLSTLWNDSKVASFAETGRLLLQLCKAGLI